MVRDVSTYMRPKSDVATTSHAGWDVVLSNLSIYYTDKISAPTWKEEFELPDRSYSVSDIQDYFAYILKKHGEKTGKKTGEETDTPSIKRYTNK